MDVHALQTRLAHYYLARLRAADTAYRRGQLGSADTLALLGHDWAQIAQWQAWAAAQRAASREAATLCAAYPQAGADILATRQTPQERVAWLEAGAEAARATGDARGEAVCLFRMAWAIHKQATLERAEVAARAALERAEALGDALLTGQCLHLLGEITVRRGDFEASEPLLRRSLALLEATDARPALADVLFSLSENAYFRGDHAQARDYALECYRIHTALGLNPATTNNLTCVGIFTAEAGDLDAGEAYVRQSVALCRSSGAQNTLAHALKTLGGFLMLRDEWKEARCALDECMELAQATGEAWLIPDILMFRARFHSRTGDHAAARRDAQAGVVIGRETGYGLTLLEGLLNLAYVLVVAGELDGARAALTEGLALAVQAKATISLLFGAFVATRLWERLGDAPRAAALAGMLLRHPGVECAVRAELPALRARLAARLGDVECEAAIARGAALRLDAAVEDVLSAFVRARPRPK